MLLVCVHSSTPSQMAEENVMLLSNGEITGGERRLRAWVINPLVVEVMKKECIDRTDKRPSPCSSCSRMAIPTGRL